MTSRHSVLIGILLLLLSAAPGLLGQELKLLLDADLSSAEAVEAAGGQVSGGKFVEAGGRVGYVTEADGQGIRLPAEGHLNRRAGRIEGEVTFLKDVPESGRVESYITQPYQPPSEALSLALSRGKEEEGGPSWGAGIKSGGNWTWASGEPVEAKAGHSHTVGMEWGPGGLELIVDGDVQATAQFTGGPLRMPSTLPIGNAHAMSRPSVWFAIHRIRFWGTGEEEEMPPVYSFGGPKALTYAPEGGIGPAESGGTPFDWDRDGRFDIVTGKSYFRNLGREHRGMILLAEPRAADLGLKGGGSLRFGDFDGDGLDDLILATRENFQWYEDTTTEGERKLEFRLTFADAGSGEDLAPFEWGEGAPMAVCADWDGDGRTDLIVGTRSNISKYWPTGPNGGVGFGIGFFEQTWIGGETHGTVYFHRNVGSNEEPKFTRGRHIPTGPTRQALVLYDAAFPSVCDFNDDGRLDLVVASLDTIAVYLNEGTPTAPRLDAGRLIEIAGSGDFPFERNGVYVVNDRDNHSALLAIGSFTRFMANTGDKGAPRYAAIERVYAKGVRVCSGHFSIPDACDWDGDGDIDIVCGSEDGFIWLIENTDPEGGRARWQEPVPLTADERPVRLYSPLGLQGPCEGKWGYTNPCVADWDLDGDLDLIAGWIREQYVYWENVGSAREPKLAFRGPLECEGRPLHVAWRTRPAVGDLDGDGIPDLIGVNGQGNIAWWKRVKEGEKLALRPPQEVVSPEGAAFHVTRVGRGTGRTKLAACDWDGDGKCDLFAYLHHYRNVSDGERVMFEPQPDLVAPSPEGRWGHYSMIEPVDWDGNGKWEMLAGRDNGFVYYFGEVTASD